MLQPDTFFKYMGTKTGRVVIESQSLRWSTPGRLNDPYDIQFDLKFEFNREAVKVSTLNKLWEAYSGKPVPVGNELGLLMMYFRQRCPGWTREKFEGGMSAAIDEGFNRAEASLPRVSTETRALMAKSKVLCLTTTPDNSLMWTHYAEAHKGVVLRFRNIPELDSPYVMAKPVQYVQEMPVLMNEDFISDMMSGRVSLSPPSILDRMVYTKSSEWAYENEWRIYSGAGRNPDAPYEDCPFGARELDAIIFGCRTLEKEVIELTAMMRERYPHAEILQAQMNPKAFRLEIVTFGKS